MKHVLCALAAIACLATSGEALAKKKSTEDATAAQPESLLDDSLLAGLAFREIGPALTSGRISDIAVHPEHHATWYVAAASGGVWKTTNAGNTWTPIFDGEGSYSIGCVTLDPNDPDVVWVGSGENNSQRSVSYGDGVYKSIDGGKSWKNMGLGESEHIGRIVVDPRDSDTVYVAAQGPLWSAGGDRGVYKTTDGGETWQQVLEISEHTGVNEVWMDPRDPDVLYASSYQRRRRTWTLINGGPESAIYKSVDAGASWTELTSGLPTKDMGKIGLAISPADPDVVYAIIESLDDANGTYRSTDAGASWEKRGGYTSGSGQYYNELVPDPLDPDRVYSMDTFMHVSNDGGKTFEPVPETSKHVDNHALWIDPGDTDHLVAGCDGGVYESWDAGANWDFKANLPLVQFYKIAVDNDLPFYNVYGGTQDNSTLGGPSRNTSEHGITNRDWLVVIGGDGFKPAVDPENPDIVYSQSQYGNLVRYDRATREALDIQPQPEPGEDPSRWNWDSALAISPHSPSRLYFASQRVYRSDDRGDTWRPVSGDLTRALDRNKLPVMGKVWGVDTVAKNRSTSFFGTVVSLSESPRVEGLLYAGSDDGLIQVSENGGESWREEDTFPGVPDMSYVSDIEASAHDDDTVYATFDNHKSGDFAPYVLKSTDRGVSWSSIAANLPDGAVYTLAEDPEKPELLFVGNEYGVHVSVDGGGSWVALGGGMPTIAVRDLVIQERESDLVAGTFGRGFFILDDYSALREMSEAALEAEHLLFPVRRAWMFMRSFELGYNGRAFMGDDFYSAPNPPQGAVFTYYSKEGLQTLAEARREAEKERDAAGEDIGYPSWEELRAEERQEEPAMVLTVRDADGNVVRRLTGPAGEGLHRVAWDLRYPPLTPTRLTPRRLMPWSSDDVGWMVPPGVYSVTLGSWENSRYTEVSEPQSFAAVPALAATLPAADRQALADFQARAARLERAVLGAARVSGEVRDRIAHLRQAALDTPGGDLAWRTRIEEIESRLEDLEIRLFGDPTIAGHSEPTPPSISGRIGRVTYGLWTTTSAPTATQRRGYEIAAEEFAPLLADLTALVEGDLAALEAEMEAAGAPWTPGRMPVWSPESP